MSLCDVTFLVRSNNIFVPSGSRSNSLGKSKSTDSNGSSGNGKVRVIICWFLPVETSVNVTSVSVYLNNCNGSICLNFNNNDNTRSLSVRF